MTKDSRFPLNSLDGLKVGDRVFVGVIGGLNYNKTAIVTKIMPSTGCKQNKGSIPVCSNCPGNLALRFDDGEESMLNCWGRVNPYGFAVRKIGNDWVGDWE